MCMCVCVVCTHTHNLLQIKSELIRADKYLHGETSIYSSNYILSSNTQLQPL